MGKNAFTGNTDIHPWKREKNPSMTMLAYNPSRVVRGQMQIYVDPRSSWASQPGEKSELPVE